jgi:hypothetical protein
MVADTLKVCMQILSCYGALSRHVGQYNAQWWITSFHGVKIVQTFGLTPWILQRAFPYLF